MVRGLKGQAPLRAARYLRQHRLPYLFVLPAVVLLLLIEAYPLYRALDMSFHYNYLLKPDPRGSPFIGLANYIEVVTDSLFYNALKNTLVFGVGSVALRLLLGFVTALLLNTAVKGRTFFRGVLLLPWITPGVIVATTWRWIFSTQYGLLNGVLRVIGLLSSPYPWLARPETAVPAGIIANGWAGYPFVMLMILAALQGIPRELYEAAEVDGAGRWQEFWHVTLPMIKQAVLVVAVLQMIWTFNSFDLIYVLTGGGPAYKTQVMATHIYQWAFSFFRFGYATAAAVLVAIFLLAATYFWRRLVEGREGG